MYLKGGIPTNSVSTRPAVLDPVPALHLMGELSWMSKRFAQQVAAVVACDESLLAFDDVGQLVKRFNQALEVCDFGAAAAIIQALFQVDRHNDSEDSHAVEVQRIDQLCQCLVSFCMRLHCSHQEKGAFGAGAQPFIDEPALDHLGAVNTTIQRHSASQRFRRKWLLQPVQRTKSEAGEGRGGQKTKEMLRLEQAQMLYQCHRAGSMGKSEAGEEAKAQRKVDDSGEGRGGQKTKEMLRFEQARMQCFMMETELRRLMTMKALDIQIRTKAGTACQADFASVFEKARLARATFERIESLRERNEMGGWNQDADFLSRRLDADEGMIGAAAQQCQIDKHVKPQQQREELEEGGHPRAEEPLGELRAHGSGVAPAADGLVSDARYQAERLQSDKQLAADKAGGIQSSVNLFVLTAALSQAPSHGV